VCCNGAGVKFNLSVISSLDEIKELASYHTHIIGVHSVVNCPILVEREPRGSKLAGKVTNF